MFDLFRVLSTDDAPDDPGAGHWARLRRPGRHNDESLTGTTRSWLRRLPAGRRPWQLCLRFPRVANRIAWCWSDAALCEQMFDDLLVDHRGGRAGFPRPVVAELRRLRDYHAHLHGGAELPRARLFDGWGDSQPAR